MKWYTHAAVGANAVWVLTLGDAVTSASALYAGLGAFGALLPDIDAGWKGSTGAKIHYIGHGVFGMFKGAFRHRGFFHSFLSTLFVFCFSIPFAFLIDPFFPIILTLGYASHLFIDAWNGGMFYFYPLKKDVSFIPRFFRFRVGSLGDNLFFVLGVLGLLLFLFSHQREFLVPENLFYGVV